MDVLAMYAFLFSTSRYIIGGRTRCHNASKNNRNFYTGLKIFFCPFRSVNMTYATYDFENGLSIGLGIC